VVAGLKKGLGELGYTPPLLVLQETKIARTAEKAAKSVVEGLLRQKAQIFLKHLAAATASAPVFTHYHQSD
jgi:hypothetical protein